MRPETASLMQWLQASCPFPLDALQEIPGDASFRRYFRLKSGVQSYIVMDASQQRDCFEPFAAIAHALHALGAAVPTILAQDAALCYMLLSDFGDLQYLRALEEANADRLYKNALASLSILQSCRAVPHWTLPSFDYAFMQGELAEFQRWFLERYLNCPLSQREKSLLQATFSKLCRAAESQPQVFIHRDYHSANLMVLPNQGVGILDFQDACRGPLTYDLVSLLRDCYIDWPEARVQGWLAYFYHRLREARRLQTSVSFEEFQRWFDWMGLQRHMKALFIFARKYLRDHTPRYLQFLPRTLNYIVQISERYPELQAFHHLVRELRLPREIEEGAQCGA